MKKIMTITIYTIKTADHYRLGAPAIHALTEPADISRAWISRAEYDLSEGYSVAESNGGALGIYNAGNIQPHDTYYAGPGCSGCHTYIFVPGPYLTPMQYCGIIKLNANDTPFDCA